MPRAPIGFVFGLSLASLRFCLNESSKYSVDSQLETMMVE